MAESTIVSNTENLLKYLALDQKGKVMAEYVWIDADGGVRSKTKVCVSPIIDGGSLSLFFASRATPSLR
jgi:hypothetical protein